MDGVDGISGDHRVTARADAEQAAIDAFRRGDYTGAAAIFLELLDAAGAAGERRAEIAYNLAQSLLQLQDYDGARYYLDQANGCSTPEINRRTEDLLRRFDRLDDALAVVEPHLAS